MFETRGKTCYPMLLNMLSIPSFMAALVQFASTFSLDASVVPPPLSLPRYRTMLPAVGLGRGVRVENRLLGYQVSRCTEQLEFWV